MCFTLTYIFTLFLGSQQKGGNYQFFRFFGPTYQVRIQLGRLCYNYVWEIVSSKAFLHLIFFIFSHSQQKRLFDTSLIYVYPTEIVRYFHKLLLCYSETLSVDCYILEAPFSLNPLIEFLKNYQLCPPSIRIPVNQLRKIKILKYFIVNVIYQLSK